MNPPVSTEQVIADERRTLDAAGATPGEYYALCLSGGGIRSACFALGLIQGLAARGLLRSFDYLSTVSGGGFAGGWLSAWLTHAAANGNVASVFEQLAGRDLPAGAVEPTAVTRMRIYSRYMNPRLGTFSADTWTIAATMIRNILLNWLVLLPLLAAVLLVPRAYLEAVQYFDQPLVAGAGLSGAPLWLLAGSLFLIILSLLFVVFNLPSYGGGRATQPQFVTICLAPLVAGSVGLTLFWATDTVAPTLSWMIAIAVLVSVATWTVPGLLTGSHRWRPTTMMAAAVSGPVSGVGLWWLATNPFRDGVALGALYSTVALPALLLIWALQITLFVALARSEQSDADLEWHSRSLAWLLIAVCGWLVVAALVFYAPLAFAAASAWIESSLQLREGNGAGLVGAVGSLVGAALAQLARMTPSSSPATPSTTSITIRRMALKLAAPLFALVLLGGLATVDVALMERLKSVDALSWLRVTPGGAMWGDVTIAEVLAAAGILAGFGLVMARFVPVNRFSLHGMYRQRLIRAFLGASRSDGARRPNPFTGFDPHDNLALQELAVVGRPLHIVNTTLNAVAEPGLAMQFRKAEAFTMSPQHCGSPKLNAFRPTAEYADERAGAPAVQTGISLGTALSISGAAASPNMGANSTPSLTFLMTLFNARLGVWLGNPKGAARSETWRQSEPTLGAGPLLRELLGRTTDRNPYVYLSDGGHFENLGLWSMVQRRCRGILVSDAGADPEYTFADLANAVRLIREDFGIPIVFETPLPIGPSVATEHRRHYAVGRILYSAVDGPAAPDGRLIYVKASLTGREPVDVTNYASSHPTFPHESTADQSFTEAQFESYRVLGMTAAQSIDTFF